MSDSVFVTAKERAAWVIEKSRQVGPIDYYITGPATNFASMLSYLPEGAIRRVVMMAGRLGEEWDKTPIPDFNIACDPFAFQKLLESSFEVVLVPVNTTYLIRLSLDEVNKLKASNDVALFLKELMVAHCRYFSPEPVFYFHDPSVLFVQEFPSCLHPTKIAFDNDPESPSFGKITKMREGKEGYSVCVFTPNEGERSDILAKILSTVGLSH
jgi:inosine-uridine nucleoside N-ribohydrolase